MGKAGTGGQNQAGVIRICDVRPMLSVDDPFGHER
jgi:hypothetical protein